MKKRRLISFSLIIIMVLMLFLVNSSNVFSAASGNGNDYPGGSLGSCSGTNCIWSGQVGIRFSLVDGDGTKVSGTHHIDAWVMNKIPDSVKRYELWDDKGNRLWNFDGAYYGNQIKQEVIDRQMGLQYGEYFKLSHVYNLDNLIPGSNFISSYDRWSANWVQTVAEYIINKTTTGNAAIIDNILKELGYGDGAIAASNAGYFLQYEPIILNGRLGRDITNYIFIGTPTEYYAYDQTMSGKKSPWFATGTTGVYIYRAGEGEAPTNFKVGTGRAVDKLLTVEDGKIVGEGVAHIWIRDLIDSDELDCSTAVSTIKSWYLQGKINLDAYHVYINRVRLGTFKYTDENGVVIQIDRAYNDPVNYYYLIKENYMTLSEPFALCEPKKEINVCDEFTGANVEIDDCTTGKSMFGDIEDSSAWLVCEIAYTNGSKKYSSDNTGHIATNGDVVGNNEYCEVFCYEEVSTVFPTHVKGVKAGQTFTWGGLDGTFGTVKFEKKCSTQEYKRGEQGYRFAEWSEKYKANEKELVKHYMNKAAYEKAKANISTSSSSGYTETYKCTCTNEDGSPGCCGYTTNLKYRGTATATVHNQTYSADGYLGSITGSSTYQSYSTGSGSGPSLYQYSTSSAAKAAAKAELETILDNLISSELNQYTGKLNDEAELLKKIRQCTNNIEYVYETTVQFTFKEPINQTYGVNSRDFSFEDELLVTGSYNKDNVDTSKCIEKTVYSYVCSGNGSGANCTPTAQKVLDCTMVTWELNGVYEYTYPTEYFYWYTLKTDSTLVNERDKGSEDAAFFYSVGFGLPTALSLTDGTYELKAVVYNLGDNGDIAGETPLYERPEDTHFDPLGVNVVTKEGTKKGFEYICTYEVENEIFGYDCQYDETGKLLPNSPKHCDEREDGDSDGSLVGIDIAYRLITLLDDGDSIDKAFPGRDGNGREPKGNWAIGNIELYKILDSDVYNGPAMYEIMLDVNAIQTIRKDNQTYFEADKDPYASYYDANNAQKVYCATDGNEKYCASDFISDLYNGSGLNYRLLGTCLPSGNTLERAEYVLENGCDTPYTYPTLNWKR